MTNLADLFGRRFPYLRLSVTDICNFHCPYCLPDGYQKTNGKDGVLSLEEVGRLLRAFAELKFEKVRFTGGEPTVRKDLIDIVRLVSSVPGIEKAALTTNGFRIKDLAKDLLSAGITSLNVSVDSLDQKQFKEITGHDRLEDVLYGIETALDLGYPTVKVNTVLMKGINAHELDGFFSWVQTMPITVRFIELMQTGNNAAFFSKHHFPTQHVYKRLFAEGWKLKEREKNAGPAEEFVHQRYEGSIGVIAPYARDFCSGCNRMRVDCYGRLYLCLFDKVCYDLKHLLQTDAQKEELQSAVKTLILSKAKSHALHDGDPGTTESLVGIGG